MFAAKLKVLRDMTYSRQYYARVLHFHGAIKLQSFDFPRDKDESPPPDSADNPGFALRRDRIYLASQESYFAREANFLLVFPSAGREERGRYKAIRRRVTLVRAPAEMTFRACKSVPVASK